MPLLTPPPRSFAPVDDHSNVPSRPIRVGHTPDADDAYMFHGMVSGAIDLRGLAIEHVLEPIHTLGQRAMHGELEVTAVSVHAYAFCWQRYAVLAHGASFGRGYGPMLVAREPIEPRQLQGKVIAVPGKLTSAYLGLRLFLREFQERVVPFDQVMQYVQRGQADAGLVITEGQLTHAELGLVKVWDMGEWWEAETGLPLPLGINLIRTDTGPRTMRTYAAVFRESIAYALTHRAEALEYALQFGRGIDRDTASQFIGRYVNERTLDMDDEDRLAILAFLERGHGAGLIPAMPRLEFVSGTQRAHPHLNTS